MKFVTLMILVVVFTLEGFAQDNTQPTPLWPPESAQSVGPGRQPLDSTTAGLPTAAPVVSVEAVPLPPPSHPNDLLPSDYEVPPGYQPPSSAPGPSTTTAAAAPTPPPMTSQTVQTPLGQQQTLPPQNQAPPPLAQQPATGDQPYKYVQVENATVYIMVPDDTSQRALPPVSCQPYASGYSIVLAKGNQRLGNGYFEDLRGCTLALNGQKNNLVCGAHDGGAAVFSTQTGVQFGNSSYRSLSDCLKAVQYSDHQVVCGAQEYGAAVFSLRTGHQLGFGFYEYINDCYFVAQNARNSTVCAADMGSVIAMSIETEQKLGGYQSSVQQCVAGL